MQRLLIDSQPVITIHPVSSRRFLAYLMVSFVVFGALGTTAGATLPMVIRYFQWDYLVAGWLFGASSLGYLIATWLAGCWIPSLGLRRIMALGWVLQALGMGCFGIMPQFGWNICCFAILGLGQGMIEVSINVAVVRLEPGGQGRMMNLVHSGFTIGAILAPFGVATMAARNLAWQWAYGILGGAGLMMFGWTTLNGWLAEQVAETRATEGREPASTFTWWRQPFLIFCCLSIFFYVGAEIGISNWLAEYFVQHHRSTEAFGANMVAIFWIGIFAGRLGLGMGWGSRHLHAMLMVASLLALASLALAILARSPFLAGCFYLLTGLGYSVTYPCVMSAIGHAYPLQQSQAIGYTSASGGFGVLLFPLMMSILGQELGIQSGFWFYWGLSLAMAGTILLAWKASIKRSENGTLSVS